MSSAPQEESWYDQHVLPWVINWACGGKPFRRQRQKIIPLAQGRVLEVGIGTGLNMPFYDRARVKNIVGVDPALRMHPMAIKRIEAAGFEVRLVGLSAERLPIPDACFDTIVCTYTLCTIPDPIAALREMRRVLAPGGKLLFSEHGKAPDASVFKWQSRVQPWWGRTFGGCQLDRDIPALLVEAGFKPEVQSRYIPGLRLFSYNYWGEATADNE